MHAKKRLLIVEDQPDAAGVLARISGRFQYQTLIADCGALALDIASWWRPDIVAIDLGLPDMDGLRVAAVLRAQLPEAKLICMTGRQPDRATLDAAGFNYFLPKPVSQDRLKLALVDGC